MKLFKVNANSEYTFVKEVFSFVGATNAVYADDFKGFWLLEAGDKKFVFTAAVEDEWLEVHRDTLLPRPFR
jgi:hypothetical protein